MRQLINAWQQTRNIPSRRPRLEVLRGLAPFPCTAQRRHSAFIHKQRPPEKLLLVKSQSSHNESYLASVLQSKETEMPLKSHFKITPDAYKESHQGTEDQCCKKAWDPKTRKASLQLLLLYFISGALLVHRRLYRKLSHSGPNPEAQTTGSKGGKARLHHHGMGEQGHWASSSQHWVSA